MNRFTDPSYLFIREDQAHYWAIPITALIDFSQDQNNILKDAWMPTEELFQHVIKSVQFLWPHNADTHFERIKLADLQYPILMHQDRVIDGMHRIVKAYLLGIKQLPTRHLKCMPGPEKIKK